MIFFKHFKKNYYFYTNIEIQSSNILSSKIDLAFVFLIIYYDPEYIFRNGLCRIFHVSKQNLGISILNFYLRRINFAS